MGNMQMNRTGYTSFDDIVAAEVRAEIRRRGASVTALAEVLGMRRTTLSGRVNGQAPFTPSTLAAVARQLGTTASALTVRAEKVASAQRAPRT